MSISINDLPERYKEQVRRKLASPSGDPRPITNMELANKHVAKGNAKQSTVGGDLLLAGQAQAQRYYVSTPCTMRIIHFRKKLPDFDGCCIKWIIDSLVEARILENDTGKEIIERPKEEFVKVNTDEEEKTVIEIYEANE